MIGYMSRCLVFVALALLAYANVFEDDQSFGTDEQHQNCAEEDVPSVTLLQTGLHHVHRIASEHHSQVQIKSNSTAVQTNSAGMAGNGGIASEHHSQVHSKSNSTAVQTNSVGSSALSFFAQTGYHMTIIPLMLLTCVLAYIARPSTSEIIPAGFRRFKWSFLLVWSICVGADWLQGPYVYALYDAYGFSHNEIAQLFVAGFGSSLVFGCVVGTVTDKFGRKRSSIMYCILYILSCLTKHYKSYGVLMLGRITGGMATSLLFSSFECWLVSEHCSRNAFSQGLLSYMFGMMYSVMYAAAIAAGFVAEFAANSFKFEPIYKGSIIYVGGFCTPFDLAICCLIVGTILIVSLWQENYGASLEHEQESLLKSFKDACGLLSSNRPMLLLGCIVACFEGSMFAFVFNWTPALESEAIPPPYGIIFALFMMACMCGASLSVVTGSMTKPSRRLVYVFVLGIASFLAAASALGGAVYTCFFAFMIFEFCCGVYFPSIGLLKSDLVPEHIRATVYNIYRMPLNAVVVGLLLSDISIVRCFELNAALQAVSLFSIITIISYQVPTPEKHV